MTDPLVAPPPTNEPSEIEPGATNPSPFVEVLNPDDEFPQRLADGRIRTLIPVPEPPPPPTELLADVDDTHEAFAAADAELRSRGL